MDAPNTMNNPVFNIFTKQRLNEFRISLGKNERFIKFAVILDRIDKRNDRFGNWLLGVSEKKTTSFKDILDFLTNLLMLSAGFGLIGQYVRHLGAHPESTTWYAVVGSIAVLSVLGVISMLLLIQGAFSMARHPFTSNRPINALLFVFSVIVFFSFYFFMAVAIGKFGPSY